MEFVSYYFINLSVKLQLLDHRINKVWVVHCLQPYNGH